MVTIVVDETGDAEFSETGTTLREAISIANATGGVDRIEFDQTVFSGGSESLIRLSSTLIIDESVVIDGLSAGGVTITGDTAGDDILQVGGDLTDAAATGSAGLDDNVRVIAISEEEANTETTLIGLTITGGRTTGSNQGQGLEQGAVGQSSVGAGILVQEGTLVLSRSTVTGNSTEDGEGGGVAGDQRINLGDDDDPDDFIRIFNSTISHNISEGKRGGGVFGSFVEVSNSTISSNATLSSYSEGGGIFAGIGLIIANSTVIGNHTEGFNSYGGGIATPNDLRMINSTVTGNWTEGSQAIGGGVSAWGTSQGDGAVVGDTKEIYNSIILGNEVRHGSVLQDNRDIRFNKDENIVIGGGNLVGEVRDNFSFQGGGSFITTTVGAVFANVSGGRAQLTDNGGSVETIALRNSASNPAIDASGLVATDADATGRPAQDYAGVGASSLPGTRDLGAYELPILTGGLPKIKGTKLDDILNATSREELLILFTGADVIRGTANQLDGDAIKNFGDDDRLVVQNAQFDANDVNIVMGSAILNIDTDDDDITDTVITLRGNFSDAAFSFVNTAAGTRITVDLDPNTGTSGRDVFVGTNGKDIFNGAGGNDLVSGKSGADNLTGGSGKDQIIGGRGNDKLFGGAGVDTIEGGAGNDILKGQDGADRLFGGDGRDNIFGGAGADVLKGGSGADRFIYASAGDTGVGKTDRDIIRDFKSSQSDRIDLRPMDAKQGKSGDQAFEFIGKRDFSDIKGELRIKKAGDDLIVMGDVNGDGRADFSILVADKSAMTTDDFLL